MSDAPSLSVRNALLITGMALLAVLSWVSIADNIPTAVAPWSFAVVLPLFEGGPWFAVTVVPVLFLLWSLNLVAGQDALPPRSLILLALLSLGCITWFAVLWRTGVQHQGLPAILFLLVVNIALIAALWMLATQLRRSASWRKSLLFHWLLFAWPAWCGFPWLGEGI